MTKKQSLLFKIIFFLLGAGIIVTIFCITMNGKEISGSDIYVWTSIIFMYIIVFSQFIFSALAIGSFSVTIPSAVMAWTGTLFYTSVSVMLIVFLKAGKVPLNAAIIAQAVLLFLFFLSIFFGYFAGMYIQSIKQNKLEKQEQENRKEEKIFKV
ncbi:MAG: hypothetical protein LBV52_00915 [Spirochaetaceae bacterium]|jgi:hypothetical protein|nr:hypothetical protein [Spirochaetaceae bacterium]